jgi:hypothetical protein
MTNALDLWLNRATRQLSRESTGRVRSEICEHYESAREAALIAGATNEDADSAALAALGDAGQVNRQYRRTLLTRAEARMLGEGNREARIICSHKAAFVAIPLMALLASSALFLTGRTELARTLLAGGGGMSLIFAAIFLPIYTPARSRVFRYAKWVVMAGIFVAIFGEDTLKFSWLTLSAVWPVAWIDWTRASIRRKLPQSEWPRHLYL